MTTFAVKEKRSSSAVRSRLQSSRFAYHSPAVKAHQAEIHNILRSVGAQAKLTIGQPDDEYEQEADRVADRVMAMPDLGMQSQPDNAGGEETLRAKPLTDQITPLVQRQGEPAEEEEEPLQAKFRYGETVQRVCAPCSQEYAAARKQRRAINPGNLCPKCQRDVSLQAKEVSGLTPQMSPGVESRINSLRGGGQPLDHATRSFFEPRFGRDFSHVRVHTDSAAADTARSINARAFTLGEHVVMGSGEYRPNSQAGLRLLGHELTHVVQQDGGSQNTPKIQRKVQVDPFSRINEVLGYFNFLCSGSWSSAGQNISGNANVVGNQSCTCIEDVVNDPNRTYRIQIDTVGNSPRSETLYDGSVEPNLPYPTSGPRTEPGASPLIHMPAVGSAMDFGSFNPAGNAVRADNWRILAHELCGHARLNQGYTGDKGDRPEHNSTINTENQIAAEHGGPPRGMYNDRRQGESYHCLTGNPSRLVFALVDGFHYEASAAVQNPPITQGNIQGQVTASSLRIRQGPSTSTPVLGHYPSGAMINIECQTPGTSVNDNSLWDKTNLGYVSDRYVHRIRSSSTQLPTCDPMPSPVAGVIYGRISTAVSGLQIRQAPSTSSPSVGSYGRGEVVSILCQTNGSDVLGSTIWNQTDRGYISDRYVERLPPNAVVPIC